MKQNKCNNKIESGKLILCLAISILMIISLFEIIYICEPKNYAKIIEIKNNDGYSISNPQTIEPTGGIRYNSQTGYSGSYTRGTGEIVTIPIKEKWYPMLK